jgi:hypothetical protein
MTIGFIVMIMLSLGFAIGYAFAIVVYMARTKRAQKAAEGQESAE